MANKIIQLTESGDNVYPQLSVRDGTITLNSALTLLEGSYKIIGNMKLLNVQLSGTLQAGTSTAVTLSPSPTEAVHCAIARIGTTLIASWIRNGGSVAVNVGDSAITSSDINITAIFY